VRHTLRQRWGGFPTEIVLRFRDATIEIPTKRAYHAALQDLAPAFQLPDASAEAHDPDAADGTYRAVIRRLIDQRRGPPISTHSQRQHRVWFLAQPARNESCGNLTGGLRVSRHRGGASRPSDDRRHIIWAAARRTPATRVTAIALLMLWVAFLLIIVRPLRVWDAGVAYAERREPKHPVNQWPTAHTRVEPMLSAFKLCHRVGL
jgi:hypothetical protein